MRTAALTHSLEFLLLFFFCRDCSEGRPCGAWNQGGCSLPAFDSHAVIMSWNLEFPLSQMCMEFRESRSTWSELIQTLDRNRTHNLAVRRRCTVHLWSLKIQASNSVCHGYQGGHQGSYQGYQGGCGFDSRLSAVRFHGNFFVSLNELVPNRGIGLSSLHQHWIERLICWFPWCHALTSGLLRRGLYFAPLSVWLLSRFFSFLQLHNPTSPYFLLSPPACWAHRETECN